MVYTNQNLIVFIPTYTKHLWFYLGENWENLGARLALRSIRGQAFGGDLYENNERLEVCRRSSVGISMGIYPSWL